MRWSHQPWTRWLLAVIVAAMVGEVAYHAAAVVLDCLAALGYPYRLDYGEGIVWQQALLMFGPEMYSPSPDLPFIVFHYPPLYHFLVRALILLQLDPLFAGRLISGTSTAASSICIVVLALGCVRGRPNGVQWVLAVTFGLLFLCLTPVRAWGIWMRVDLLAVFLGLAATIVAAQTRFSTVGTTVALLLGVAAVFTKQTHLSAGIAIFAIGMLCARRQTLVATVIAGGVGLGCLALLEVTTHGFLKNIIIYNINPINWSGVLQILRGNKDNLPYLSCIGVAALLVTVGLFRPDSMARLRAREPSAVVLGLVTVHFWVAAGFALQIVKDGASDNYFLDFMGVGCVLLAAALADAAARPVRLAVFAGVIALTTSHIQGRRYHASRFAEWTRDNDRLVEQVRASPKPVSSDDMIILLRAGKRVIFEPAIVRALTASGAWDPSALLEMFHRHEFAMAITAIDRDDEAGPVVTAAIAADYPVVKQATLGLKIHLPAGSTVP